MFSSQKEAQQHVSDIAKSMSQAKDADANDDAPSIKFCGNLACQHDSFLKTLSSSKLISHASFSVQEKKGGKGKKKKNQKSKDDSKDKDPYSPIIYAISLSDSVFFPEGGGQPADKGTLTFTHQPENGEEKESVEFYVQDAQNVNEICVLLCRVPPSVDPEYLTELLDRQDLNIHQAIDWERRFDVMTQHSGQHLCSAVAISDFDINTHTFSLGEKSKLSYIDFTIDASWEKDHAMNIFKQIETKVNAHIRDNIPMTPRWLEKTDPLFQTEVRSRLLPEGLSGPIRLVEIEGGIDFNTCCGTHVPSLGQLQMIKFFRGEKVKPTIFRIYFAAAGRLVDIMNEMYSVQASLTSMMSCQETEQVQRVTQLLEEKRIREAEVKSLNAKLSACQAKEVAEECKLSDGKLAVVDLGDVDMGYMTMLSTLSLENIDDDGAILLLVGCEDGKDEGSFLLIGNKAIVDKIGKQVAEKFNGRGGGRNGKFQGKGTGIRSSLENVKEFILDEIKSNA